MASTKDARHLRQLLHLPCLAEWISLVTETRRKDQVDRADMDAARGVGASGCVSIVEWGQGDAVLQHNAPIEVKEVVPGKAAVVELNPLLEVLLKSEVKLMKGKDYGDLDHCPFQTLRVLGNPSEAHDALYPIMALLGAIEHGVESGRLNAIWRCTILR